MNKSLIIDPIERMKVSYFNDSIVIQRDFSSHQFYENIYFIEDGQVYDYRYKDEMYLTHRDRLLFLSNKCDTTYDWQNYYMKNFIVGHNRLGTKVIIKKISDNLFRTELISKFDSSYSERYFYDHFYHIKRFEYTYKGFKVTLENKNR
ncbi:MAG: hypothetical protein ACOYM7_06925 [Paludibacter sp.]